MFKNKKEIYNAYTMMEMLVVMTIIIIITGMGTFAFSGLRDSVSVNQDISNLKMNIQRAQHSAMLLRREPNEVTWPYGIGIDFSNVTDEGYYSFFKWRSPSSEFNSMTMNSELLAYDDTASNANINNPVGNGILPVGQPQFITPLTGFEDVYLKGGNDTELAVWGTEGNPVTYIVFESVTGRAFLYDSEGWPVNYSVNGQGDLLYDNQWSLVLGISRSYGRNVELVSISPSSGIVTQTSVDDMDEAMFPPTEEDDGIGLVIGPIVVTCVDDLFLCPDGSYVGRIAPSCEFEECSGGGVAY